MDTHKDDLPILNVIEIDEQTAEPTIVSVDAKDLEREAKKRKASKPKTKKSIKESAGTQLVMNKILGFTDDNSINKRQKLFKNICSALFVVLILCVLAFTAYKDFFANEQGPPNWWDILNALKQNWYFGLIAVLTLALNYFFKGLKLTVMCKSMTGKWHFITCMETAIIGHYYNNVTPLAVGGQPFEIYHLSKHGVHGGVATSLPICAYFLNQIGFVALGLTALLLFERGNVLDIPADILSGMPKIISTAAIIGFILGVIAPLMIIIFSILPRFCSILVHFVINLGGKLKLIKRPKETTYKTLKTVMHNSKCIKKMATNPLLLVITFIISLLESLSLVSIAYFTLKFFGFGWKDSGPILEWLQICQLGMILYLAISFIPTPGNSGAADFSFFFLFQAGLLPGLAFPAMMTWRVIGYYSFIILGFIFLTWKKNAEKKHPFEETE